VHTMDELKLTGNSLKGSRPILSFDKVSQTNIQHIMPFVPNVTNVPPSTFVWL